MRKYAVLLLIITVLFFPAFAGADLSDIEAEAYILVEEQSGQVLAAKNVEQVLFPASTTKILTALVAVEYGDLDTVVTVGEEINRVPGDGSRIHLRIGDRITLHDLLWGMLLRSGNDAAYTVAVHIARKNSEASLNTQQAIEAFAAMMNERAWEAGARNSNFVVPDGYHHPQHYSTAYDLAMISRTALAHGLIRKIGQTLEYSATYVSGGSNVTVQWRNTNQLLHDDSERYFPLATGFKTGFTDEAEFCLVSTAASDDLNVLAVTLKSSREGRWQDSQALLEYGLSNYLWHRVSEPRAIVGTVPVTEQGRGQAESVDLASVKGQWLVMQVAELERIETEIILNPNFLVDTDAGPALQAPLREGQMVGRVIYSLDGDVLLDSPLVTVTGIEGRPWWEQNLLLLSGIMLLFLWYLIYIPLLRRAGRKRKRPLSR